MTPAGFETAFQESERLQTHVLDRAAFGIGTIQFIVMVQQQLMGKGLLITEAP